MMGCIRYGVSFVFVIGVDVYFVNFFLWLHTTLGCGGISMIEEVDRPKIEHTSNVILGE